MNGRRSALFGGLVASLVGCGAESDGPRTVGQLESDRIELVAEFSEPIIERRVTEGQPVSADETVLQLDNARARSRVAELTAALEQQQSRLAELTRGPRREQIVAQQALVAGARQELAFRATEYERAQDVHDRQLASPESLDRAKAAYDAASSSLDLNEARLTELLAGTTIEELKQAQNAVRQAEARLETSKIDLARHTLVAPVDGLVDSVLFEIGETPPRGVPTAVLLAGAQPYARVYVPEPLRAHVVIGTAARVFVDGVSEPFAGRVRWVASDAAFTPYFALTEYDRGRLSYVAKVDIESTEPRLPDGIPVEVEFELP